MEKLHWECGVCEACGVCARTEDNCAAYHEFFQIKDVDLSIRDLYSEYTVQATSAPAHKSGYQQVSGW